MQRNHTFLLPAMLHCVGLAKVINLFPQKTVKVRMALDLQQRSDFGVFARCCFVRYTNDKKHSWSEPYQQAIPVLQGPGQGSPRHRKQVRDTTGQQALRVLTATVQQESANYGNEMGPRATPWVSRGAPQKCNIASFATDSVVFWRELFLLVSQYLFPFQIWEQISMYIYYY